MTDILARQRQLIGTSADWLAADIVLGSGELGVERVSSTEIKIKIGDGVNKFSALPYVAGGATGGSSLQLTGGTLTGPLVLPAGAPTGLQALAKDEADKLYVNVSGDTLTGPLVLPAGAPTGLQALAKDEADKLYVLVSNLLATSAGAPSAGKVPKLNTAGKIDASFLSIPGGMTFKGTIDPTAAAPATPSAGDYYFASKQATLGATWTGLAGTHIKANDSLLYDGTKWHSGPADADLDSFVSKAGDTMTGALVVPAGTVAAPSVASAGDLDTGVYFPASDKVGVTAGGAERANFSAAGLAVTGALSATGVATFFAGSAAAPAITTSGDTNTGVYFPAADTVGITAGGTQIGAFSSTGLAVTGTLSSTGNTTLGDATTDTVTVNGYVGVGGAANASYAIQVTSSALTGVGQIGVFSNPTITSAATTGGYGYYAKVNTAAATFTVADVFAYRAVNATKGAGSTITNQYGVYVDDQTQGTNNYGVTSVLSSGANKYNIYASGTAQNVFAGNVSIGSTAAPTVALDVTGAALISTTLGVTGVSTFAAGTVALPSITTSGDTNTGVYFPAADTVGITTGGTERMRIDSSGNVLVGKASATANGGDVQVSKGITFPANQIPSSDANTLDDYEEGTWTPSLGGDTTYKTQSGFYTKVGNLVTIWGFIYVNVLGTGSTKSVSGLPYACNSSRTYVSGSAGHFDGLATNALYLRPYVDPGNFTSIMFLNIIAAGAASGIQAPIFGNSARVYFSITYMV